MRKVILYIFGIFSLLSCGGGGHNGGDSPSGGSEYLNVSSVDITGDQTNSTLTISASQNCEWVISWSDAWISSISPTKGRGDGTATITTTINPSSTASRTAVIRISNVSGTIVRNVTITQSPSKEFVELSASSLTFASAADSQEVTISSNTHWTITGGASWITTNKTEGDNNGVVRISTEENSSKDSREVVLTISGSGGTSKQLTIKQAGATHTTLSIPQITDITQTSAVVGFSYDSSNTVTTYGVCYGTSDDPTIENSTNISKAGSETQGPPSIQLTELSPSMTYYVCAYVVNADGIKYSNSVSFTTASDWPGGDDNNRPNI